MPSKKEWKEHTIELQPRIFVEQVVEFELTDPKPPHGGPADPQPPPNYDAPRQNS